jgi:anion-transporting  ArsA/GET3 family ATPase
VQTLDRLQVVADALPEGLQVQVLAQASARVQQHEQVLERLLGQVSTQAVPAIERAIERTSHGQEVLDALQQGQSPSDLAPGQNKEEQGKDKERGPKRTPGPPNGKNKP